MMKGRNFMLKGTLKSCLTLAILMAIVVFIQACGRGQTNTASPPIKDSNKPTRFTVNETIQLGELGTNGLKCILTIGNDTDSAGRQPPLCYAGVMVTVTNDFRNPCWRAHDTNYLEIELFDSSGKPVERTAKGENYRHFPSEQQVEQLFKENYNKSRRRTVQGFGSAGTSPGSYGFTVFGIPDLFQLKESGEYTLKVKMRLIVIDLAMPLGEKLYAIPLPEVSAKIQIRTEGFAPTNLQPNVQTNSPIK
jgi:hypothetical protein